MSSSTPRKPDISPSSLVINQGLPTLNIDSIPQFKSEQESEVGKRFVVALSKQTGLQAELVRQSDDRADIVIRHGSVDKIEVQLVECRDVRSQLIETVRDHYENRISAALHERNIELPMHQCITISADDLAHNLPTPGDDSEVAVVEHICNRIEDLLQDGQPSRFFPGVTGEGPQQYLLIVLLSAAASDSSGPLVRWPVARTYGSDDPTNALRSTVETKIAKHYQPPANEFWLLIYSRDYRAGTFDLCERRVEEVLGRANATFTRLWYLDLQANGGESGELTELQGQERPHDQTCQSRQKHSMTAVWTAQELMRGVVTRRRTNREEP